MHKARKNYVACYWTGKIQLTNGEVHPIHCVQISNKSIEIETPSGLKGCKKSLLMIDAINHEKTKHIQAICSPKSDILNEYDKHYISFDFLKMSEGSQIFINNYINEIKAKI